jgi:hypothetical protein
VLFLEPGPPSPKIAGSQLGQPRVEEARALNAASVLTCAKSVTDGVEIILVHTLKMSGAQMVSTMTSRFENAIAHSGIPQ